MNCLARLTQLTKKVEAMKKKGCMENPERRIRSVRRVRITVYGTGGAWDKNAHAQQRSHQRVITLSRLDNVYSDKYTDSEGPLKWNKNKYHYIRAWYSIMVQSGILKLTAILMQYRTVVLLC